MSDPNREPRYFQGLQQAAFMKLEHAASLKGLLKVLHGIPGKTETRTPI
jgi:hypothetical protein